MTRAHQQWVMLLPLLLVGKRRRLLLLLHLMQGSWAYSDH
jgi:hypothetical protein